MVGIVGWVETKTIIWITDKRPNSLLEIQERNEANKISAALIRRTFDPEIFDQPE